MIRDIKPRSGDNQLGRVAAGKLLARKRPHLIPVYDSRVEMVLKDQDLVSELGSVRARAGADHLSLLRTFDIMCWMFGEPGGPGQNRAGK